MKVASCYLPITQIKIYTHINSIKYLYSCGLEWRMAASNFPCVETNPVWVTLPRTLSFPTGTVPFTYKFSKGQTDFIQLFENTQYWRNHVLHRTFSTCRLMEGTWLLERFRPSWSSHLLQQNLQGYYIFFRYISTSDHSNITRYNKPCFGKFDQVTRKKFWRINCSPLIVSNSVIKYYLYPNLSTLQFTLRVAIFWSLLFFFLLVIILYAQLTIPPTAIADAKIGYSWAYHTARQT